MSPKAILLVSHGSHSPKTKLEVIATLSQLKLKTDASILEYAFLEIEEPDIPTGIELCVQKGAKEIIVLLNFLNSGKHVDVDIPRIVKESQQKHPQVIIRISSPVGQHPKIIDLFLSLIK